MTRPTLTEPVHGTIQRLADGSVVDPAMARKVNVQLLDNMSAHGLERLVVALIESETPWTPGLVTLAEHVRKEVFG